MSPLPRRRFCDTRLFLDAASVIGGRTMQFCGVPSVAGRSGGSHEAGVVDVARRAHEAYLSLCEEAGV